MSCLYVSFYILCIFSVLVSSELCSDSDLPNCIYAINSSKDCLSESENEVNQNFSLLISEMNLHTIEEVKHIIANDVNSMILQIYLEMSKNCNSNESSANLESFVTKRTSYLISPLENSNLISAGYLYELNSPQYLIAWKKYNYNSLPEGSIPPGHPNTTASIHIATSMSNQPFITELESPKHFLVINTNELIPKVEVRDVKLSGPVCNNGHFLRLRLQLPIFAISNCDSDQTNKFKQRGQAVFEVPFAFIDINQCDHTETINLHNCQINSYCNKLNYSTAHSNTSFECDCNVGYYKRSQECHQCHPSCYSCTSESPCYTEGLRWALLAWNFIVMLICICLIIITIIFSYVFKHESFVSSAPPFLLLILIGSFLMYTTLIVEYFPPSSVTCILSPWFFYPGFSLAFGSLIIKSWRIIKLYKESHNWKHNVKPPRSIDWHLFLRLLPFIFITVITLTAWTLHDMESRIEDPEKQVVTFLYCKQDDWNYLIIVANLLLIVFGVLLAVKARTIPQKYRETRDILFSIYNITIVNIMCTAATHTLYSFQQDVNFVVLFVNLHLGISFMIFIMFRKKVTDVFYDKIIHKKKKPGTRVNDTAILMTPQERIRFLTENKLLQEMVVERDKRIKVLQEESQDNGDERNISAMEIRTDSLDGETTAALPSENCTEGQCYELSTYFYLKRDSATESEIHLELGNKIILPYTHTSPISTDL